MTTLLLTHPACLEHDTGYGHPERADRLRAIDDALAAPAFKTLTREQAPLADLAAIERLHPEAYVEMVRAAIPKRDHAWLDPDTVVSPGSWEAALRATGAALHAVDQVMAGKAKNAFCAVRPPGHHAEPSRAMGFCLFNTVAVAALHARAKHGAERVAVVDFDVHHGNGTQAAFWTDKDLFYGSTHQMPLFPGTGALGETGVGNICNAPLEPGDDGEDFRAALESRILPALDDFAPDFLLGLGRLRRASQGPAGADQAGRARFCLGDRAAAGGGRQAYRRQARLDARGRLRPRCPGKLYGGPCGNADGPASLLILGAGKG